MFFKVLKPTGGEGASSSSSSSSSSGVGGRTSITNTGGGGGGASAVKLISPTEGVTPSERPGSEFSFDMKCLSPSFGRERSSGTRAVLTVGGKNVLTDAQASAMSVSPTKHGRNEGDLGAIAAAVHPIESPPLQA